MAIVSFVKKYPISLCGFTLLFLPSVHRLLLYFTPLLLSTAIFIVAMKSWGPSSSSSSSDRSSDDQWSINGSLRNEEEDQEEEEEQGVREKTSQNDNINAEPDPDLKQEPDPDLQAHTATFNCISETHPLPDPEVHTELSVGTPASATQIAQYDQAEPDPDSQPAERHRIDLPDPPRHESDATAAERDPLHAAATYKYDHHVLTAEPDPDLHGDGPQQDQHAPANDDHNYVLDRDDHHSLLEEPQLPLHGEGADKLKKHLRGSVEDQTAGAVTDHTEFAKVVERLEVTLSSRNRTSSGSVTHVQRADLPRALQAAA